ncbi:MAG: ATPase domain-containing protein [Thermodesulfobacteriota bacterium]
MVRYRGSSFVRNEYPFVITEEGIRTIPITRFELRDKPFGKIISTGISSLDTMLDGGYQRASCILLAGEPRTGKTIFASTFVSHVYNRGEKVIYLSLEESPEALIHNVTSAGIHLFGAMP